MTTKTKQIKQDWKKLEPGDEATFLGTHNHATQGTVDATTAGSDVIWIVDQEGRGRRAFDHREGINVLAPDLPVHAAPWAIHAPNPAGRGAASRALLQEATSP